MKRVPSGATLTIGSLPPVPTVTALASRLGGAASAGTAVGATTNAVAVRARSAATVSRRLILPSPFPERSPGSLPEADSQIYNMSHMTERRRKAFSATVPEWLLKEVSARYENVSEFTERALETQLQLDRQVEALETLAGNGNRELGRRRLEAIEKQPGYPELEARWMRER